MANAINVLVIVGLPWFEENTSTCHALKKVVVTCHCNVNGHMIAAIKVC